jgi:hypothetical protein
MSIAILCYQKMVNKNKLDRFSQVII